MTTPRDVQDRDGITWTLAQALAGASGEHAEASDEAAGRLTESDGTVPVVATPSGGARTVRLELPAGWAASMSDDELLAALREARS